MYSHKNGLGHTSSRCIALEVPVAVLLEFQLELNYSVPKNTLFVLYPAAGYTGMTWIPSEWEARAKPVPPESL